MFPPNRIQQKHISGSHLNEINPLNHCNHLSQTDQREMKLSKLSKEKKEFENKERPKFQDYSSPHTIWTEEDCEKVCETHKKATRFPDYLAYGTVFLFRNSWDLCTGYLFARRMGLFGFSPRMWLFRLVFLETMAGVPGMMLGMVRHLNSLRRFEKDRSWIKTLLSEAENERLHLRGVIKYQTQPGLLTALYLYKPGAMLKYSVMMVQGIMCNLLFAAYVISPRYCHSLVGYLEEEAVHNYTLLLEDIENGKYPQFNEKASDFSQKYWKLDKDASWKTVFQNMRADDANHRDVNHTLAELTSNPRAAHPFRFPTNAVNCH
jgi:hypothetical protein